MIDNRKFSILPRLSYPNDVNHDNKFFDIKHVKRHFPFEFDIRFDAAFPNTLVISLGLLAVKCRHILEILK